MKWLERHRWHLVAVLLAVIVAGGAVFLYRMGPSPSSAGIVIVPPSPEICVYVEGEVVSPGVYVLDDGDRVVDAIEAAGGFTGDADRGAINLAAVLRDGDQVHVFSTGSVPQKVNLNTAEAWVLEALPGIGEVLARRIIDYRTLNGGFQRVEELKNVDGIGDAAYEKLKDIVTVH
jgi:competence protein ComEA